MTDSEFREAADTPHSLGLAFQQLSGGSSRTSHLNKNALRLSRYAGLGNRNNSVDLKKFTAFEQNPVRVFLSRFLWNGTVAVEIKAEALTFQRLLGKCGFSTTGRMLVICM